MKRGAICMSLLFFSSAVQAAVQFSGAGQQFYVTDGSTLRACDSSTLAEKWKVKELGESLVVDRTSGHVAAFDAEHANIYDARGRVLAHSARGSPAGRAPR